jgi:hypothetical protein
MDRSRIVGIALVAVVFFALGLVVADRMTPAAASAASTAQDSNGAAFAGTEGAVVMKNQLYVIRGPRIYRIDPATGGTQRPWADFAP